MVILNLLDLLVVMIFKIEYLFFSMIINWNINIFNFDIRREEVAVRCEGSV